jgi:hypothetical protein
LWGRFCAVPPGALRDNPVPARRPDAITAAPASGVDGAGDYATPLAGREAHAMPVIFLNVLTGDETLAEIGRSYNVSGWTISRLTA